MTPRHRQSALIARYQIIPDPHERLAALTSRQSQLAPLPPEARTDALLVPGCVSRVWLAGSFENGKCHFQMHAESALVKGLAATLCELYDDATPEEILAVEPELFETLGIAAHLTPTRLNGLAHIRARIVAFARQHLT
ncbi:MAG: SufE family protein [Verrucomicrobia bacterium]|nr:SufE family protein [Verrucomicrobiota bacterium]